MGMLGILFQFNNIDTFKLGKLINIKGNYMRYIFTFFVLLIVFSSKFSFYPIKPRASSLLIIGSSVAISFILTLSKKVDWKFAAIATWFLGSYSFYFFIMKDPRTHVYVAFIPLFMLAAYGFVEFINSFRSGYIQKLVLFAFVGCLFYISGLNWIIFVDKSPEYPWWDKTYLGRPMYHIERIRYKKIEGVFGFNNFSGWKEISDLYKQGCLAGTFNSNEKNAITYFYMRFNQKQGNAWGFKQDADTLALNMNPHSWEYTTPENMPVSYNILKVIESHGVPVTYIYGSYDVYKDGKLLCE